MTTQIHPPLFNRNGITGLSEKEAQARLQTNGPNILPSDKRHGFWNLVLETLREPMSMLLLLAGGTYLCLGDLHDALMLLAFVFVLLGIAIFQRNKTECALEALRELSSPRAIVIRDGIQHRIPGAEVVIGDIIFLKEGDRVPADGVLLFTMNLMVDESILTGESLPVHKTAPENKKDKNKEEPAVAVAPPGGDGLPFAYSGTLVVQGQGYMEALRTGLQTEMGKIGKALENLPTEKTFLNCEMEKLVRYFALAGLIFCLALVGVYGIVRGHWLEGILAGITLAMAMIPEEFPVVLTIFTALGAWRLSKQNVLIRRVPVVETLGAATVLCVDKTGTLTQNRMQVEKLATPCATLDLNGKNGAGLDEAFHALVEYSILASQRDPFDPMEKAFHALGEKFLAQTEHLHTNWSLVREYPLSKALLAMSLVWRSGENEHYAIAAKGAPEAIIDLCHFSKAQSEPICAQVMAMAGEGLRVIAVAKSSFKPLVLPPENSKEEAVLPAIQHEFDFEYLGLIGLSDPLRDTAKDALAQCQRAGIRVIMMTGDYPQTASHIARQAGFAHPEKFLTGSDLSRISDVELNAAIQTTDIFARMVPEQKLRLVNALKAQGETVAMTGDGVNDAPALKAAHIGLAMGGRGSDVAREAAGIVLLDDDFTSIVEAVKMGRRIFENIRKAVGYLLAIHIPISGLSLIPVFMGLPLLLLPIHIAFLHLVIDPACSVVFEAEPGASNLMARLPRNPQQALLDRGILISSILQGVSVLTVILALYILDLRLGHGILHARALAFTTLIIGNLCLIVANRSGKLSFLKCLRQANPALKWVIIGTFMFLAAALLIPPLKTMFHFGALYPTDWVICSLSGILSVLWLDILK